MTLSFPSLHAFRASNRLRRRADEVDLGGPWRTAAFGPSYRAAWMPATGELFVEHLGPSAAGGGTVEILAHVRDADVLAELLRGWQRVCGGFDSIRWLRARVARAHPLKSRYA